MATKQDIANTQTPPTIQAPLPQSNVVQDQAAANALAETKRRERLEQNRISARESRKRKKTMIEELQRSVINLSRENKEWQQRNEIIKRQLMELGAKVIV